MWQLIKMLTQEKPRRTKKQSSITEQQEQQIDRMQKPSYTTKTTVSVN